MSSSQEPNPSQIINSGNVSDSFNHTVNFSQSSNCGNVNDSYNTVNNYNSDERRHILEWLSPLAPRLRHQDVKRSQVEGVGDWLLRTDEFKNWNNVEDGAVSPVLFCYGDPGVGKTHLRYGLTFSWANGDD